ARRELWHQILEISSEQVFSIVIIAGLPQPVVAHEDLRNVPEEATFNGEPGRHTGSYGPDTVGYADRRQVRRRAGFFGPAPPGRGDLRLPAPCSDIRLGRGLSEVASSAAAADPRRTNGRGAIKRREARPCRQHPSRRALRSPAGAAWHGRMCAPSCPAWWPGSWAACSRCPRRSPIPP